MKVSLKAYNVSACYQSVSKKIAMCIQCACILPHCLLKHYNVHTMCLLWKCP